MNIARAAALNIDHALARLASGSAHWGLVRFDERILNAIAHEPAASFDPRLRWASGLAMILSVLGISLLPGRLSETLVLRKFERLSID